MELSSVYRSDPYLSLPGGLQRGGRKWCGCFYPVLIEPGCCPSLHCLPGELSSCLGQGLTSAEQGQVTRLSLTALWLHLCFGCFSKSTSPLFCAQDRTAGTEQDFSRGRADCSLRGFPQRERGAAEAAEAAVLL